ncbi:guanylate kinase [Gammaproteobacteria bacterium]|nr:guanylate kinase [Gammaproteobacteria bacterium]
MDLDKISVISAPSGAGKSSLVNALLTNSDRFFLSKSHTTRLPRVGEVSGEHYYFTSREAFLQKIKQNDWLEYAEVYGNFYGTCKRQFNGANDKNIILELDIQGAMSIKQQFPHANLIFILPPSYAELNTRLVGRNKDDHQVIMQRLDQANQEVLACQNFDYVVMNDDFDRCLSQLIKILARHGDAKQFTNEHMQPVITNWLSQYKEQRCQE